VGDVLIQERRLVKNLNLCREQPLPYVGSIEQLAPVRRVAFREGKAKSVEAVQVERDPEWLSVSWRTWCWIWRL